MEKGENIYVKRDKIYGEDRFRYQEGIIDGIYPHHILVEFRCKNGKKFRESFFKYEIIEGREKMSLEDIY